MREPGHRRWRALLIGLMLAGAAAAGAGDDAAALQAGALMLASACFNCHGTDGTIRDEHIPAIAGVPQSVIEAQLIAFKQGQLPATVMDRIAGGFTDEELAIVAAHFAAQRPSDGDDGDEAQREAP
jgi:cytochrome subunit of sulfide dehydrogenase